MRVTLADVAHKVGISASTVSRALSAPERVNAETRRRVMEAVRELGYLAPVATVPRQTGILGLIVPDIANPFFPPIIKAVQARAAARNRTILIADIDEHPADELRRAKQLAEQADGLIVVSARTPPEQFHKLVDMQPIVLVNREWDGVASVNIENGAGIVDAVEHLVALGHRRLCYLNGPRRSWSNQQRQGAVREACERSGVELIEFGPFEPQIQAGMRAADLVCASPATAVIAYDDLVALGVMTRLNERGIQVGTEISVIGIDDSPMSGMVHPSLTSIQVPGAEAGMTAVDILIDLIAAQNEGRDLGPLLVGTRLETRLVVRTSTAPPPTQQR